MPETNGKASYCVGVDLGGTKILSGVFDSSFELLGTAKVSTKAGRGSAEVMQRIARCVREAVDEADLPWCEVRSVGIGAPGTVDGSAGNVIFAPNLGWHGVPLKNALEEILGLPVVVENDCNVATLGVYTVELKSKPRDLLGLFIGTGIGGGLVINGELHCGFGHTAGEIGHMVLDLDGPKCACGHQGCFEALASRTAMLQRVKTAIKAGEKTVLTEILENVDAVRSGDLRKAYRRGDNLVQRVVEDAARCIGVAVANLANTLNPEVIVLGGGVIEALADEMLPTIEDTAHDYAIEGALQGVQILTSHLGDHAGITGCAVLAQRKTN